MNIVGKGFHIRELGVRTNVSGVVARALPTVIDQNVRIAHGPHPGRNQCVSLGSHHGVAHVTCKMVPTVPAHGWCSGQHGILSASNPAPRKQNQEAEQDGEVATCNFHASSSSRANRGR